jgi:hypothetical protein
MSDRGCDTFQNPSVERLWAELGPRLPQRPPHGKTVAELAVEWGVGRSAAQRQLNTLVEQGRVKCVDGVARIGAQMRRTRFYVPV